MADSVNMPSRTVCFVHCASSRRNIDRFLHMDTQFVEPYSQGPQRAKAACQGDYVQEAVVGHSHQCLGHFCVLFFQQLHYRFSQGSRLRSLSLENAMVRS